MPQLRHTIIVGCVFLLFCFRTSGEIFDDIDNDGEERKETYKILGRIVEGAIQEAIRQEVESMGIPLDRIKSLNNDPQGKIDAFMKPKRSIGTPPLPQECNYPNVGQKGDLRLVCVPKQWNGDLLVGVHGYTPSLLYQSPYFPFEQFVNEEGGYVWDTALQNGYAFIASGFSRNGFVIFDGFDTTADTIRNFTKMHPETKNIYVDGASMGGMIGSRFCSESAMKGVKDVRVSGCLSAISPIGSFSRMVTYLSDIRALFDYYYPFLLPGDAVNVPNSLVIDWWSNSSVYMPLVVAALILDPIPGMEIISVMKIQAMPLELGGPVLTLVTALTLHLTAVNDFKNEMGCQPYNNVDTIYSGSLNDHRLNRHIKRYSREGCPYCTEKYETPADLMSPLVLMLSTTDPVIEYTQMSLFESKIREATKTYIFSTDTKYIPFTGLTMMDRMHTYLPSSFMMTGLRILEKQVELQKK